MNVYQELFSLLTEDEVDVPLGQIAAKMLAIELAAGGVTPEHTEYVRNHHFDLISGLGPIQIVGITTNETV